MKEIEVEIKNEAGLHARPSSLFVQTAGEYDANVTVVSEGEEVNESEKSKTYGNRSSRRSSIRLGNPYAHRTDGSGIGTVG